MTFAFVDASEVRLQHDFVLPIGCEVRLIPTRAADGGGASASGGALVQYKQLCDVLLPALRARSHLHNVIYRHRHNITLALIRDGVLLGGATFRVIEQRPSPRSRNVRARDIAASAAPDARRLIVDVLLLAVDQRRGVCGVGHGSRIVNCLKALARSLAAPRSAAPLVLTQADIGVQALNFWARQVHHVLAIPCELRVPLFRSPSNLPSGVVRIWRRAHSRVISCARSASGMME